MVLLSSYPTMPDAMIVQGMLKMHGITTVLRDRNNMYVPVFGGVDMLVDEADYEKARLLLDEHHDA
ncbi:MAG: DUF2007 domain-containing protein [Bacteroidales bacterium]|nr:DUF2007 domain-containing protein [Bacteroidales bacterium]